MKMSVDDLKLWNEISKNLHDIAREPHKYDLDTEAIIKINEQLEKVTHYLRRVKHITST